jgi:hypothetical protein
LPAEFDHQTVWYRAPEMAWEDPNFDQKIDLWSVGLILAEMCGEVFHKVRPQADDSVTLAAYKFALLQRLGTPTGEASSSWTKWKPHAARDRQLWPTRVRDRIGTIGEELLNGLLEWDRKRRPTSKLAGGHSYLHPLRFALGGHPEADEDGRRGFVLSPPEVYQGARHPWNILTGTMGVETVQWLRLDLDAEGVSSLNIDFEAARPDVRAEEKRKFVLSGKLCSDVASGSMCAMSLAKLFPLSRFRAWFAAFKTANGEMLSDLSRHSRTAATRCDAEGKDRNKLHFLESPFDSWFVSAAELTIAKANGDWAELVHQDGGASVIHMGVTIYGERTMNCQQPELANIVVRNQPGTVYLGGLTGPVHGVVHTPSPPDQLLQGNQSVSIMCRTTLFPHTQSRQRGTTPHPVEFFRSISASFAASFKKRSWRLPTLAECIKEYDFVASGLSPANRSPAGASQSVPKIVAVAGSVVDDVAAKSVHTAAKEEADPPPKRRKK